MLSFGIEIGFSLVPVVIKQLNTKVTFFFLDGKILLLFFTFLFQFLKQLLV